MNNGQKLLEINLSDILPNRFQPRIYFDDSKIVELSDSIRQFGVLQPIIVREHNGKYEIIAGERRYKASKIANKKTIPAIVISLDDKSSMEVALLENIQRQDLNPIEESVSYKKILDMWGTGTQQELATKMGKSQSAIANKIRLLKLPDEVQEALMNKKISERHARSLLKLKKKENQIELLHRIIDERLTVRRTDEEIDKLKRPLQQEKIEILDFNDNFFNKEEKGEIKMNNELEKTQPIPSINNEPNPFMGNNTSNVEGTFFNQNNQTNYNPFIEENKSVEIANEGAAPPNIIPAMPEVSNDIPNPSSVIEPSTEDNIPFQGYGEVEQKNPGFVDVNQILNNAEDINKQEEKPQNLFMPDLQTINMNNENLNQGVMNNTVEPTPQAQPFTPIAENQPEENTNKFFASPTVPIVEEKPVEVPTQPFMPIAENEPIIQNQPLTQNQGIMPNNIFTESVNLVQNEPVVAQKNISEAVGIVNECILKLQSLGYNVSKLESDNPTTLDINIKIEK